MAEKKFGDTPIINKSLFDAICEEKKEEGFEYAGVEFLTKTQLGEDGIFGEQEAQTKEDIKRKYLKGKNIEQVELMPDIENPNKIYVFLKFI